MEKFKYKIVNISTANSASAKASILIIYTGGTLGMTYDEAGVLAPFNFSQTAEKIPALRQFDLQLTVISFPQLVNSSDINPNHWVDLAYIVHQNYQRYDGFVVVHGTDTMAYSASALSFMLEGLNKPVIFTGAQLPIGSKRSDAQENFITALEIASAQIDGHPIVPEVCVYFGSHLLRGNRSSKRQSIHFNAFTSENYPSLAEAGVLIDYNFPAIRPYNPNSKLVYHNQLDSNVAILKLFPGINRKVVESILQIPDLKGLVLETFGSGNAPTNAFLLDSLSDAIQHGLIILNISQCAGGRVIQGRYKTSKSLENIGVVSGKDMTTEAAITKLMYLLGTEKSSEFIRQQLPLAICGETY